MNPARRAFLARVGTGVSLAVAGCSSQPARQVRASPVVVVVGAGYAGATAAKYIKMWAPEIRVVLVEPAAQFMSCPLSNLVVGGSKKLADISASYFALQSKYAVQIVVDEAIGVDFKARSLRLASGGAIVYDRLILAPGVQFMYDQVPGLASAEAQARVPHAWKAGTQTEILRAQLEAMRDGGVFAMHVPRAPYRCPPGPYERACQVAHYFKQAKPRCKVLVLDANEDIVSKKALFAKAWKELYPGMIEYRPNSELVSVDAKSQTARLTFEDVKADVLNVIPPQKAAQIAERAGLVVANNRWCEVDFLTYESKIARNVHVLGDAILAAPNMPKSGHMANAQAKICASAVVALLRDRMVNPAPMLTNTCYSFVTAREAVHVASVHRYDTGSRTMLTVNGSGGLSAAPSAAEAEYALAWAKNIWADMLA